MRTAGLGARVRVSNASSVCSRSNQTQPLRATCLRRQERPRHGAAIVANAATATSSRFSGVEQAPPDPILGVSQAFKADEDPSKLNLGVGAYRDDNLQPVVLNVVRKAEKRILDQKNNKEWWYWDPRLEHSGLPKSTARKNWKRNLTCWS